MHVAVNRETTNAVDVCLKDPEVLSETLYSSDYNNQNPQELCTREGLRVLSDTLSTLGLNNKLPTVPHASS